MFPTLEDGVVGMRDEVLEMGLLIRRRRNLVLPTVTCDKSHIVCDKILFCFVPDGEVHQPDAPRRGEATGKTGGMV